MGNHVLKRIVNITLMLLCVSSFHLKAQKYFVSFADKNDNEYSIHTPSDFLSQRAIDRRNKQSISITEQDLPVTTTYLDSIKKMDVKVYWSSKWLNGVILESDNKTLMDTITRVSFVSESKLIWEQPISTTIQKFVETELLESITLKSAAVYGLSWNQTQTINGQYLHNNSFQGENMVIAVLDAGFKNANNLESFNHLWNNDQILTQRDVVNPQSDFYAQHNHGANVLSVMGGFVEGNFKGSAPEAKYHLIRTEDSASEFPIEEYNWVVGAEYADSIGADIINSSLGYYSFDNDFTDYTHDDLDGKTTIVVKGAESAFSKGMIVVNSAGNEGNNTWNKIISPADGVNVLSVAAMKSDSTRALFSSYGYSADGRVKPDVTAIGQGTALQLTSGDLGYSSGTSFSAPIIAGFAACLWQAHPNLTNVELVQLIKESCNNYSSPDNSFGYGIPNFEYALGVDSGIHKNQNKKIKISPNPFTSYISISGEEMEEEVYRISIYNSTGNKLKEQLNIQLPYKIDGLEALPKGIYLYQIKTKDRYFTGKIVKK